MCEDGPVAHNLRRILFIQIKNKVVTSILSGFLFVVCISFKSSWNILPFLILFLFSLIYSVLTFIVLVCKQSENVTNCGWFKKVFGANANFNEIQSTMAMVLAMANISGIFLRLSSYNRLFIWIGSFLNVVFFLTDWYVNSRAVPEINDDLPEPEYSCCTKCFFGGFKKCPIFFNFIQAGCWIASITLIAQKYDISIRADFYFYCSGFVIVCLILHTVLQFSKRLRQKVSTASVPAYKWQTYLFLIIAFYSLFAIIYFALINHNFDLPTMEKIYGSPPDEDSYLYNNEDDDMSSKSTTIPPKNDDLITTNPPPENDTRPFYYKTVWHRKKIQAITELPIAFALSSLAFLLSLFRLHPFVLKPFDKEDKVAPESLHDNYTQTTDGSIKKFSNLPPVIEFLQNADEIKKQPTILM